MDKDGLEDEEGLFGLFNPPPSNIVDETSNIIDPDECLSLSELWSYVEWLWSKPKDKSWAEVIDSNVWFHGLYGLLDGISVAYSTLKFSCELLSSDSKEYHDNLDFILSGSLIWLPVVIIGTLAAAIVSVIGSYSSKKDNHSTVESLLKKWLPYIRDTLKGGKNGYKAIKTLIVVLAHQELLESSQVRNVALPIGLVFSIAAIINRYCIKAISDKQKKIIKASNNITKQLQKASKLQMELASLQTKLIDMQVDREALKRSILNPNVIANPEAPPEEQQTLAEQAEQIRNRYRAKGLYNEISGKIYQFEKREIKRVKKELKRLNVKKLLQQQAKIEEDKENFLEQYSFSQLFTKALGGFIDGPYLYLGVLSLATLGFTVFVATSSILSLFLVACIAVRYNEGLQSQKELKANVKIAELNAAIEAFHQYQAHVLNINLRNFSNNQLQDTFPKSRQEIIQGYQQSKRSLEQGEYGLELEAEIDKLNVLFNKVDKINTELQLIATPTLLTAIFNGLQDGLSAFGALSSVYFLTGIVLVLAGTGVAFHPAFILGGAVFGLAAIGYFVYQRLSQLEIDLSDRKVHYDNWKDHINAKMLANNEEFLLSPLDCNTDGLTKGEIFFQRQFEIVRCFANGPYKAQNLTDFLLTELHAHSSKLVTAVWGGISFIYCAVLMLRAHGQTSKDKVQEKVVNTSDVIETEASDKSEQPQPEASPKSPLKGRYSLASKSSFFPPVLQKEKVLPRVNVPAIVQI